METIVPAVTSPAPAPAVAAPSVKTTAPSTASPTAPSTTPAPALPAPTLLTQESPVIEAPLLEEQIVEGEAGPEVSEIDSLLFGYDRPMWRFRAENIWLTRTVGANRSVIPRSSVAVIPGDLNYININKSLARLTDLETNQPFTRELRDIRFPYSPGGRFTLSRAIYDCQTYLEASYLGMPGSGFNSHLQNSDKVRFQNGDTAFLVSQTPLVTLGTTAQDVSYRYDYHTVDLIIRSDMCQRPYLSPFLGFRYISLDEAYRISETGSLVTPNTIVNATRSTRTTNDMFGVEIGTEIGLNLGPYLRWNTNMKAALLADPASSRTSVSLGSATRTTEAYRTKRAAGAFDLGTYLTLQITSNFSVRGGYQLIFISGYASATEQNFPRLVDENFNVDLRGGQVIDLDGDFLMHGPFFGGELTWGRCR